MYKATNVVERSWRVYKEWRGDELVAQFFAFTRIIWWT
jgi:hypothetical protein